MHRNKIWAEDANLKISFLLDIKPKILKLVENSIESHDMQLFFKVAV